MTLTSRVAPGIAPAESAVLDLLRATAALMVFLQHWSLLTGNGLAFTQHLGRAGVLLFFLMSGFLIAATSERVTLIDYAIARAARLWSVALPVVAVLFVLALAFPAIDPSRTRGDAVVQFFSSLAFANCWWFANIEAFSNVPYWSLSYEAAFYAVWGALFLGGRYRWLATLAVALIVGPRVLLLFPVWLAGAGFYLSRIRLTKTGALLALTFGAGVAALVAGRVHLTLPAFDWRYSNAFLDDWAKGAAGLAAIAAIFAFNRFESIPVARWIAQRSFTLYLVHYPLLLGAMYLLGGTVSFAVSFAVGAVVLAVALAIGNMIEPTSTQYRETLQRLLGRIKPAPG